jgi:hypothetical protein
MAPGCMKSKNRPEKHWALRCGRLALCETLGGSPDFATTCMRGPRFSAALTYGSGRHSVAAGRCSAQLRTTARGRRIVRDFARPARVFYRPVVTIFGRSSIRTWLSSVLSLCAPHWGQRSADDQAPQRGHSLCVRFGTTSLPVHRCRILTSPNTSREPPETRSQARIHRSPDAPDVGFGSAPTAARDD